MKQIPPEDIYEKSSEYFEGASARVYRAKLRTTASKENLVALKVFKYDLTRDLKYSDGGTSQAMKVHESISIN